MIFPAALETEAHHAAAQKFPHRGARAQELAGQVDAEHLVPLRQGHFVKRRVALQAGIGDENVDGAEFPYHPREHWR